MKNLPEPFSRLPLRTGFSLVELLVVIALIGILSGIMLTTMSGGTESARAASCLANMKNLAAACQTYGMETEYYPLAGNRVYLSVDESRGVNDVQKRYAEVPGWISTMTKGYFPGTSYKKGASVGLYASDNSEEALYALTNGAIWKYVSGNASTYVCPSHAIKAGKSGLNPKWSYLMNAYFGWDKSGRASSGDSGRIEFGTLARADKILLFSEIPFMGYNTWQPEGEGGSDDTDAILQYSSSGASSGSSSQNTSGGGGNEELGVNHKKGRNAFVHVAFADGHVEQLRVPMNGKTPDTTQMKQLATWLCTGTDVSFDGKQYQKVEN